MRIVWITALAALLSGAGLSLPASASPRQADAGDGQVAWGDDGPRFERRRVARATINDSEEGYEARPRRSYDSDAVERPRYGKRRQAARTERSRRGRHAVERSSRRTAVVREDRRSERRSAASSREERRAAFRSYGGGSESHGVASYYWQGQRVASGGWFNPEGLTAAHRTLPFGTRVRVTHLGNGRSVNVVINDRGPFIAGRIIDLARGAARVIGMTGQGLARVKVTVLGR
jgi:rare lipoprotein A